MNTEKNKLVLVFSVGVLLTALFFLAGLGFLFFPNISTALGMTYTPTFNLVASFGLPFVPDAIWYGGFFLLSTMIFGCISIWMVKFIPDMYNHDKFGKDNTSLPE